MRTDLGKFAAIAILALVPVGCGPKPAVQQPAPAPSTAPRDTAPRETAPPANPNANRNMPPADPNQPAQPQADAGVDIQIGGGKGVDINVDPNRPATSPNNR